MAEGQYNGLKKYLIGVATWVTVAGLGQSLMLVYYGGQLMQRIEGLEARVNQIEQRQWNSRSNVSETANIGMIAEPDTPEYSDS